MRVKQLFTSLTLGLGLTLGLLWLLGGVTLPMAQAAPSPCPNQRPLLQAGDVVTVCLSGGCDYASIQAAVDAANPGDEILVAAGTYTDVNVRPRNDITTTSVVTQVVYISKTVTVWGGYTPTNWTTPYPITQPTTLDAQGQGRVLYITGDISPTIEGLHITGGDAIGLGGAPWGWDSGGGVYVITATATISNNQAFSNTAFFGGGVYIISGTVAISNSQVFSNTADYGGGLFLYYSDATLSNNTVISNTASDYDGGGLLLYYSDATLGNNTIISNTAKLDGGGLCLYDSDATLSNNTVISNTASNGGGLCLDDSAARLSGNTVTGNTADPYSGGGLFLYHSDATLSNNIVTANTAKLDGGGLALWYNVAMLTNNVVADNQADRNGSGLYIFASSPRLLHTTIARNVGSSGVYITDWVSNYSTVALTNTILVSHTVGISVTGGNTVTVNGVLWSSTPVTVSQTTTATVTVQNQYEGDPAFAADGYHLTGDSAAIDRGVNAGVTTDIDGQSRDPIPDLGADEFYSDGRCYAQIASNPTITYTTVQAAVDAANDGDTVKIAGYCTGVEARAGVTQTAYISKTITIRGGYTTTNWTTSYPITQPTTLDAQGRGRVIYVTGNSSPTIEGLRITGGNSTGQGLDYHQRGGGIQIDNALITTISNCAVFSNTSAHDGGGISAVNTPVILKYNDIFLNTAAYNGGGVSVGGIEGSSLLQGNVVRNNTASSGYGGGVIASDHSAVLVNNTIVDNNGGRQGSGLYIGSSYPPHPTLLHNTVARNIGGDGSGIYLGVINNSTVVMTNTIIASQTVGIVVKSSDGRAVLNGILWCSNKNNTAGAGLITITNAVTGNPAFGTDGYHLMAGSAAIDQGVNAGVTTDIDGQSRDPIPDLGADEFYSDGRCYAQIASNPTITYTTVQAAVDAANDGDTVKVAGYCTGVEARAGVTQTAYVSKTVTVRGGYTTTNWNTFDPMANPTTLDAEGQGRVLYITGDISPTIEGLHITGGNAAGLGGEWGEDDAGGGVYIINATATISNNQVFSNTAYRGGGLYLYESDAALNGNAITANTAADNGGGLFLRSSNAILTDNTVESNTAQGHGGGLLLCYHSNAKLTANTIVSNHAQYGGGIELDTESPTLDGNLVIANTASSNGGGLYSVSSSAILTANMVVSNTAQWSGGGLHLEYGYPLLSGNTVLSNTAYSGGGLYLSSDATLNGNTVTSNTANSGGGLYIHLSDATLMNNVVAENQAGQGSGLYIRGSSPHLLHTTIARNSGGSGLYVTGYEYYGYYPCAVALTNTILVSHSVGISVTGGNTVTVNGALWYGTPVTVSQATTAIVMLQNQHEGDPAFAPDGYHLTGDSAAIDRGVNAGVTTDIDGQSRDAIPDLGADEFVGVTPVYLPLIMRQYQ